MNIKRIVFCFLALVLATATAPVHAQSNFARDFVRDYDPGEQKISAAPPPVVAQVFQTGTVPITLQDIINMMLDYNLDIRSNRLGPRSSQLQTLVFYRALQPSLRFAGTVSRNTAASTSQLNGAQALSQLRHNFSVGFAKQLPYGTSLTVDATMNRLSSNSSN